MLGQLRRHWYWTNITAIVKCVVEATGCVGSQGIEHPGEMSCNVILASGSPLDGNVLQQLMSNMNELETRGYESASMSVVCGDHNLVRNPGEKVAILSELATDPVRRHAEWPKIDIRCTICHRLKTYFSNDYVLDDKTWAWFTTVLRLPRRTQSCRGIATTNNAHLTRPTEVITAAKTALFVNFVGWFSGDSSTDEKEATDEKVRTNGRLGGVASMMSDMENLQTSQRYGKLTATLVNELASTVVEGVSPDGKVKVSLNGQQRPVGMTIDEAFFDASDAADVKQAVLAAMEEAYDKSVERMDDKMKSFYKEMGL